MKEKVLISSCLCNIKCRYDGKCITNPYLSKLNEKYDLIPVCAEVLGGLPIPRKPSEIIDGRVLNNEFEDVSYAFNIGANKVLNIALNNNVKLAILKDNSPSCGSSMIYDGNFNGSRIKGEGITTQLLRANGIIVISENELDKIF